MVVGGVAECVRPFSPRVCARRWRSSGAGGGVATADDTFVAILLVMGSSFLPASTVVVGFLVSKLLIFSSSFFNSLMTEVNFCSIGAMYFTRSFSRESSVDLAIVLEFKNATVQKCEPIVASARTEQI